MYSLNCGIHSSDVSPWPWPWSLRPKSKSLALALGPTPKSLLTSLIHSLCYITGNLSKPSTSGAGAESTTEADGEAEENQESSVQLSLKQQMDLAIQQSMSDEVQPTVSLSTSSDYEKSTTAAIKTEFTVFQTSGVRGRCLQSAYNYLLSVPPASVEAERAFSAAGLLCTKIRSRMSDKSLDALCFLRSYYTITTARATPNRDKLK